MKRSRTFNAAPARTSSSTVAVISETISASLAAARDLDETEVGEALAAAEPALLMLVSSRHIKTHPVVLVAGSTTLDITCRYDGEAVGGEENLNPVPGMGSATSFRIHFPTPAPIGATIGSMVAAHPALTTDPPASNANAAISSLTNTSQAPLDLAALKGLL